MSNSEITIMSLQNMCLWVIFGDVKRRETMDVLLPPGILRHIKMQSQELLGNKSKNEGFLDAVERGDLSAVKLLLLGGADVETLESSTSLDRAMHIAARQGHKKIIEILLEFGADVLARNAENNTALHIAAREGHVSVVKLLLDVGVDVNIAGCGRYTPLHFAAYMGSKLVCETLLDRGATINAKEGRNTETALHLACCGGYVPVVQLLVNRGADILSEIKYDWVYCT